MITLIRSATVLPGKLAEGIAWGKESSAILKRLTGKEVAFCTAFGGTISGLAWISQFDSVAQIEDAFAKVMADREYMTAFTKSAPIFVPGSGHDQMWRHV